MNWRFKFDNTRLSAGLADGSLMFLNNVASANNHPILAGVTPNALALAI